MNNCPFNFARPASSVTPTDGMPVEEEEKGSVEDILQVFRIFKLARVLKLARHSPGLQVCIQAGQGAQAGQTFSWPTGTLSSWPGCSSWQGISLAYRYVLQCWFNYDSYEQNCFVFFRLEFCVLPFNFEEYYNRIIQKVKESFSYFPDKNFMIIS